MVWQSLIAIWLWCFGANVGSFMNVVIYRLPIHSSITLPRSRCPRCRHKIRWFDNIPVVSWLVLRGRCRDCRGPISPRYPLVEGLVAAVFVLLAFIQPIELGDNLPEVTLLPPLRLQTMLTLWLMYAYQLLLWCTLLCAALIRFDGKSVPFRLYLPALLVGCVAPLEWPSLRPVPLAVPLDAPAWLIAMGDGLAGVVVAIALAGFIERSARWRRRVRRDSVTLPLLLCGLFLGWQAVAALAAAAMLLEVTIAVLGLLSRGAARLSLVAALCPLTLIYIVFWQQVIDVAPWLGPRTNILTFTIAALIVERSLLDSVRDHERPATPATGPCGKKGISHRGGQGAAVRSRYGDRNEARPEL